ncbi:MAG: hypothetical protein LRY54_03300 [Alphaproteobacteria bacterium]|nr:hypothetical protein [Alphaproteobacteria bacterium]
MQQKEAEHRKISPSARRRFDAHLFRGEKGEYLVDEQIVSKVLKVDWLHFMQEIIPDSAKPGDVELRCGGLMVAFHNAEIVKYLDDLAREKGAGRRITVSLPNRRMGVDLNEPA